MSLSIAISRFLREFAELDNRHVAKALRSLSDDASLLHQAEERLDLPARLTLLRRMAMVRGVEMASLEVAACGDETIEIQQVLQNFTEVHSGSASSRPPGTAEGGRHNSVFSPARFNS